MIAIAAFSAMGFVLGLAYFAALRWTVERYLRGNRTAIVWYVLRLAAMSAALYVLVRTGGVLVLASLGGFFVARLVAVRRAHAPPEES